MHCTCIAGLDQCVFDSILYFGRWQLLTKYCGECSWRNLPSTFRLEVCKYLLGSLQPQLPAETRSSQGILIIRTWLFKLGSLQLLIDKTLIRHINLALVPCLLCLTACPGHGRLYSSPEDVNDDKKSGVAQKLNTSCKSKRRADLRSS